MSLDRRHFLKVGAAGVAAASALPMGNVLAADGDTVTIAYNVNLPSWDPTVGLSAVNPAIQSI